MLSDFRFACRQLTKSPGFTLIAIVVVALGIGAATAMFSAVNALVLRPVALPEAERLAVIYEANLPRQIQRFAVSYPNYCDWRSRNTNWVSLAAMTDRSMSYTGGSGEPELVNVHVMTANLLSTLGLEPAVGRGFLEEEDRPGHNQVAILSHGFWQRHFGGRPDAVGQSVTLGGTRYTIVGVMPADAFFPGNLEIAIPLRDEDRTTDRRYEHVLAVYGRVKASYTREQAEAELKAIAAQLYSEYSDSDRDWSIEAVPLSKVVVGPEVSTRLYLLLGAVGLLLLITCANLSNLLLVRASARAHELAIRAALGAGRWRIVRQLVIESFIITGIGGLFGILLSLWAVAGMRTANLPRATEISVDVRVLLAACGITLLVGFLAGLSPALKTTSHADPQEALKQKSARAGSHARTRNALVVAQLGLSLSLLVGAAVFIRNFWRLTHVNPGFAVEQVLTASLQPGDRPSAVSFYEAVAAQVGALPNVTRVGLISSLPLTGGNTSNNVFPVGPTPLPPGKSIQSSWRLVDGGYFDAMRIPLLRGRTFSGLSPDEARNAVVLSASLAKLLFGDENPIGREIEQLRVGGDRLTVIGTVGDVLERLDAEPTPTFYWSMHRFLYGPMQLVVRTTGSTAPLAAAVRSVVKKADSSVPVFGIRTLQDLRSDNLSRERMITGILGGFAAAALALASLGTYGVVAFSVQQRTREIGVRIAIGAQTGDILRLVLGQGFRLVLLGGIVGIAGALAATRLFAALLYQSGTSDPLSYLVSVGVLALAALAAAFLPAWRATRVSPLDALRAE
ncbi:hypothetical protein DB347_20165 [Opitutaceae bacterium EW11]|nr:hypothetical protein DB347_20165 [Opitutaceae bacterium EW11]